MVCRPASSEIATKGMPRQTLAMMTEVRAMVGSPRKSMYWWITPSFIRLQLMIENCAS